MKITVTCSKSKQPNHCCWPPPTERKDTSPSSKNDLSFWPPIKLSSLTKHWASLCNDKDLSAMLRDDGPSTGNTSPTPSTAVFFRTPPQISRVWLISGCSGGDRNCTRFDMALIDDCKVLAECSDAIIGHVGLDVTASRRRLISSWLYVVLAARAECQLKSDWVMALVERLSLDSSRCPLSGDSSCRTSTRLDMLLSILGDNRTDGGQACTSTQTHNKNTTPN